MNIYIEFIVINMTYFPTSRGLSAGSTDRVGTVFAFTNRTHTSVKLLVYDASGFWLCQKRFSRGKLAWWPTGCSASVSLRACELMILLAQGHPVKAGLPEDWLSVSHAACVDSNNAKVFS